MGRRVFLQKLRTNKNKLITMRLATHNSLSYICPQWYLRPFAWVGRCQNLTLQEQLNYGVRYFDIRIKFLKNGRAVSGHGLLTYNVDIATVLYLLDLKKDCTVRLTLENTKNDGINRFRDFCKEAVKEFTDVHFVGGCVKGTWENIVDLGWSLIKEEYWTFSWKHPIPYPYMYAKANNHGYVSVGSNNFLMLDFINVR